MLYQMHRLMVVAATAAFALAIVNSAGARPDLLEEGAGGAVVAVTPDGYQPQLHAETASAQLRERPDGYQPQLRLEPIGFEAEAGGGLDGETAAVLGGVLLALAASAGAAAVLRTRYRVAHL